MVTGHCNCIADLKISYVDLTYTEYVTTVYILRWSTT